MDVCHPTIGFTKSALNIQLCFYGLVARCLLQHVARLLTSIYLVWKENHVYHRSSLPTEYLIDSLNNHRWAIRIWKIHGLSPSKNLES